MADTSNDSSKGKPRVKLTFEKGISPPRMRIGLHRDTKEEIWATWNDVKHMKTGKPPSALYIGSTKLADIDEATMPAELDGGLSKTGFFVWAMTGGCKLEKSEAVKKAEEKAKRKPAEDDTSGRSSKRTKTGKGKKAKREEEEEDEHDDDSEFETFTVPIEKTRDQQDKRDLKAFLNNDYSKLDTPTLERLSESLRVRWSRATCPPISLLRRLKRFAYRVRTNPFLLADWKIWVANSDKAPETKKDDTQCQEPTERGKALFKIYERDVRRKWPQVIGVYLPIDDTIKTRIKARIARVLELAEAVSKLQQGHGRT